MPEPITNQKKRKECGNCCFPRFKKNKNAEGNVLFTQKPSNEITQPADAIYSQDIPEPLCPGSCIIIRGTVKPQCKRFAVNLMYVRGPKTDIVFHFNPRLALRYIVRNSRLNNNWGDEETTSVEKFHLERNKSFELQIVASDHEYLVALDGRHICAYVYRTSLEKVNKIEVEGIQVEGIEVFKQIKTYPSEMDINVPQDIKPVEGSIDVADVKFKQVAVYPLRVKENPSFTIPMGDVSNADRILDENLVVPITAKLPNGFKTGWQLEITGRVKILPSSFYINLQQGDTLWPHPIIPLHLNPRFYTSYGNHLFVRNSWIDGEWGSEERTPGFQFTPGKWFHLAIRMNSDSFGVWVDGILAGEFRFRTPVDNIDTLYIHGDVHIRSLHLKDHVDDKYFSNSREVINKSL